MKAGEKWTLIIMAVLVVGMMSYRAAHVYFLDEPDPGIPFYSTASNEVRHRAGELYNKLKCSECHSLWTVRNMMESIPAPALDGIGSLHDEQWFYEYFSAESPQAILPSRLKPEYRMPSYSYLADEERRLLASYMASLKVEDWYLEETKKSEYEKLTGKKYVSSTNAPSN